MRVNMLRESGHHDLLVSARRRGRTGGRRKQETRAASPFETGNASLEESQSA